jgi:hypothetical protein
LPASSGASASISLISSFLRCPCANYLITLMNGNI